MHRGLLPRPLRVLRLPVYRPVVAFRARRQLAENPDERIHRTRRTPPGAHAAQEGDHRRAHRQCPNECGLLLVLTGNGKGKAARPSACSPAPWGMACSAAWCSSSRAVTAQAKSCSSAASPNRCATTSWERASPGRPRIANVTSPPPKPPGRCRASCCRTLRYSSWCWTS